MIRYAILVRHGESSNNTMNIVSNDIEGFPLTEKGKNQARFVASEIVKVPIDVIISSPILRARETAEIISSVVKRKIVVDNRLKEIGLGKFNNTPFPTVPKFTYISEEMEKWESIRERMISVLNDYNGNAVLVSHAFPIRVFIANFLDLGENESYGISIGNASISVVDVFERKVIAIGSPVITENIKNRMV